jgi:hypothetical protein
MEAYHLGDCIVPRVQIKGLNSKEEGLGVASWYNQSFEKNLFQVHVFLNCSPIPIIVAWIIYV